jgi:hypothetical protein
MRDLPHDLPSWPPNTNPNPNPNPAPARAPLQAPALEDVMSGSRALNVVLNYVWPLLCWATLSALTYLWSRLPCYSELRDHLARASQVSWCCPGVRHVCCGPFDLDVGVKGQPRGGALAGYS